MKKIKAFSLIELLAGMVVLGFLSMLTIPTFVTNTMQKKYIKGYEKAYLTVSNATQQYLAYPGNYMMPTYEGAVHFAKYLIDNYSIKELYAEENPTENSQNYSAIKFKRLDTTAGAKNPITVSPDVEINSKPSFWWVTEDNLAYSIIIPEGARCEEILNINTMDTLDKTLQASCYAIVVDTNGIYANPNILDETQDISHEKYVPDLINDRYYIFIGSNGAVAGNPKNILMANLYNKK